MKLLKESYSESDFKIIIDFLNDPDNQLLLEQNRIKELFDVLYRDTWSSDLKGYVSALYAILKSCDVDPLLYMEELPEEIFRDESNLHDVILPNNIITISKNSFRDCYNLKTVRFSNRLGTIPQEAFCNCTRLQNLNFPKSLMLIDTMAFYSCEGLESVTFEQGSELKIISYHAFKYCNNLKTVTLPEGLKTIRSEAFMNCESLESIVIPQSVTRIEEDAFNNCPKLKIKVPIRFKGKHAWRKGLEDNQIEYY